MPPDDALKAFAAAGAKPGPTTIVGIVTAPDGEFDVLQAAVVEAGLVGALNSTDNQYTVFAPTDAAFVSTFRAVLANNSLTEADVIASLEGGDLKGKKIGSQWRVTRAQIAQFLQY